MKNITLVRIDDRLIHGQVMTQWVKSRPVNTILIVDNDIAKDDFLKSIATMAAPKEFKTFVMSVDDAAEYLCGEEKDENVLILVKFVSVIEELTKRGVEIPALNVGGIGMKSDRKSIYRNIAISNEEKETFLRLISDGMKVYVQIVPADSPLDIEKLL